MSQEYGNATFLAPSPSDVDIQDPSKRSKISYTREFLLSLAKAVSLSTVKLPGEVQLSISCVFPDSTGLLSPPFCVPDSRRQNSMPRNFSLKVPDNVNQLHRSNEPYRPPCRHKGLPPSTRDHSYLLNGDTSGFSECTKQEKAERESWGKDTVSVVKEDKWHFSQNTDSKDSSEEFPISPATRNLNTLQFTSNVINKQLDASRKPSLILGPVRGNAVQPPILPETTKNRSTQCQHVQDLITNETVNPRQKSVSHIDTSWHLSMLDNGMHLVESEKYSNFDIGTAHLMDSAENILKKNHCEVVYEQGIMELQLSNTPVCVHNPPGRIATIDLSEAYISPPPVEEEKEFTSMVGKCESAMVHCEAILSLQDAKQAISVSTKENTSSPDFQIQQELELNSSSSRLHGNSNSSSGLCLPDEDSLITFDGPYSLSDEENSAVIDSLISNNESNLIETGSFSPSSPRDMVEKLVESILSDESSPDPDPYLDDPMMHHEAGFDGFFHSLYARQSYPQFCSNQLNPGRDQREDHDSFQKNSIDPDIYSLFSHSFPSNKIYQPFPLSHDVELKRFDHEVSQSMFQKMINPDTLHICSLCVSQSVVPSHLPALQMASSTLKLNPMQGCFGYQEPNYGGFIRPNPDSHGDGDINQAVVDGFVDMELRASHWHPYVGGF